MKNNNLKPTRNFALLISGIIIALTLAACASASDQFVAYIKNGDYTKAAELYASDIRGNSAKEADADDFLDSYLQECWNNYLNNELDSSDLEIVLNTYQNIQLIVPVEDLEQILAAFSTTEQARQTYSTGISCMDEQDYVGAIESFEQIAETPDNTYAEAQAQLEQAKSSYSQEILEMANEKLEQDDFDLAISLVEEAEKIVGETEEMESFLDSTYTEKYETSIEKALASSKYEEVFRLYEQATSNSRVTVSSTMTANYTSGTEEYADEVLQKASSVKETEGLLSAIKIIQEGLSVLNNQSSLVMLADNATDPM